MDKPPLDSVSLSQELRIDEIGNRFEAEFQTANRPKIEAFLADLPEVLYQPALRELLRLEFDICGRQGESVRIEDYFRRFPRHTELVREVFTAKGLGSGKPVQPTSAKARKVTATVSQTEASIQTSQTGQPISSKTSPSAESSIPKTFGRYKIEKELGTGAMGVVYLAEDTQLGRKVALKIPRKRVLDNPDALERFYREAKTTSQIRHPNICPVYDVGAIDRTHYLTMAYIPGKPISSFLGKKRSAARQVALLFRKLALGIEEAHRNGIIHRDLKPSNVMLDDRGEPIVMDFGLARQINTDEDARLTQSGAILGTPAYMAPEQVNGDINQIGPRSDIYALGVMLYQFLTGELPFTGPILTVFAQIATQQPKRPSELQPDVDPQLETICLKMMAKDIGDRYVSMKDVAAALTDYLKAGTMASASSISNPAESLPIIITETVTRGHVSQKHANRSKQFLWPRSRPTQIGIASFGVLLLMAVIIIIQHRDGTKTKIVTDNPGIQVKIKENKITIGDQDHERSAKSDLSTLSASLIFFQFEGGVPQLGVTTDQGGLIVAMNPARHPFSNVIDTNGNPIDVELVEQIGNFSWLKAKSGNLKPVPLADPSVAWREQTAQLVGVSQEDSRKTIGESIQLSGEKHLDGVRAEYKHPWGGSAVFTTDGRLVGFTTKTGDRANNVEPRKAVWVVDARPKLEGRASGTAQMELAKWVKSKNGTVLVSQSDKSTFYDYLRAIEPWPEGQQIGMITLSGSSITNTDLSRLRAAPKLIQLTLNETSVSNEGLRQSALSRIWQLSLQNSTLIDDAGMAFVSDMPVLSILSLENLPLTDQGLKNLAGHPILNFIGIANCPQITSDGMKYLANLPNLQGIHIDSRLLDESGVGHLRKSPSLQRVWFSGDDDALRRISTLPHLSELHFRGHSTITPAGVEPLSSCSALTTLNFPVKVTDEWIDALSQLKNLRQMQLDVCAMSESGRSRLRQSLPNCVITFWNNGKNLDQKSAVSDGNAPADNSLDRELAEMVIRKGGKVSVSVNNQASVYLSQLSDLPADPFNLFGIFPQGVPGLTDADMNRLIPIAQKITQLRLWNQSQLTVEGMRTIAKMRNLTQLMMSGSHVTKAVLETVGSLPDLDTLELSFTPAEDDWIDVLNRFPKLRSLHVDRTHLSAEGIERLVQQHPNLMHLSVQRLPLTERTITSICSLANLKTLMLEGADCTDQALAMISGMQQLQKLNAKGGNFVTDKGVEHLSNCKTLEQLDLEGTAVTDNAFKYMAKLPNLKTLWIKQTSVTREGVAAFRLSRPGCTVYCEDFNLSPADQATAGTAQMELAKWVKSKNGTVNVSTRDKPNSIELPRSIDPWPDGQNIEFISVFGSSVVDADLDRFAAAPKLRTIWLGETSITTNGLRHRLPRTITSLGLFDSALIDDQSLEVVRTIESINYLYLKNVSVTDQGLANLVGMPNLISLRMERTSKITPNGLRHLADFPNLKILQLDGTILNAIAIAHLRNLRKLEELDGDMDGESLKYVSSLSRLTRLGLYFKSRLSPSDLQHLSSLAALRQLNVSFPVKDDFVDAFTGLTQLTYLSINNSEISSAGVQRLRSALPNCEVAIFKFLDTSSSKSSDPDRIAAEWLLSLPRSGTGERTGIRIRVLGEPKDRDILITDKLPAEPSHLVAAQLGRLPETAEFPAEQFLEKLIGIRHLRAVALFGKQVSPEVISRLCNNPDLEEIIINGRSSFNDRSSSVGDRDVTTLRALLKLQKLHIMESELSDAGLQEICRWQQLEELWINGNSRLTATGLLELQNLRGLKNLCLNGLPVDREVFRALQKCQLETLQVYWCQLDDSLCAEIGKLTTLKTIWAHGATISDNGLLQFAGLPRLQTLGLSSTSVSDKGLTHLKKIPMLGELNVRDTNVTPAGVADFKKERPNCKIQPELTNGKFSSSDPDRSAAEWVLSLPRSFEKPPVTIRTATATREIARPEELPSEQFQLTSLYLAFVQNMPAKELAERLEPLMNLQFLRLPKASLSDEVFHAVSRKASLEWLEFVNAGEELGDPELALICRLPRLKYLGIFDSDVTNSGLKHVGKLKNLQTLWLDGTKITDTGMSELSGLKDLRDIHLNRTSIGDMGIQALTDLGGLKTVTLWKTKITDQGLAALGGLKQLAYLDLTSTGVTNGAVESFKKSRPNCQVKWNPEAELVP